jgi:hypothetical protein
MSFMDLLCAEYKKLAGLVVIMQYCGLFNRCGLFQSQ